MRPQSITLIKQAADWYVVRRRGYHAGEQHAHAMRGRRRCPEATPSALSTTFLTATLLSFYVKDLLMKQFIVLSFSSSG